MCITKTKNKERQTGITKTKNKEWQMCITKTKNRERQTCITKTMNNEWPSATSFILSRPGRDGQYKKSAGKKRKQRKMRKPYRKEE